VSVCRSTYRDFFFFFFFPRSSAYGVHLPFDLSLLEREVIGHGVHPTVQPTLLYVKKRGFVANARGVLLAGRWSNSVYDRETANTNA